jgi:DNA-binding beta-propeller fold protein YncE
MNIYESNQDANLRFFLELPDGRCLVSSHGQNAVLIVDSKSTGNVIGKLEDVQFAHPEGMAIDQKGRILIVDRYHHCIHAFDSQLAYLTRIGSRGTGNAEFNQPVGIAVSSVDGRIWIADNENNRIQALDGSTFSTSVGLGFGTKPGQLFCPCGIALYNHTEHGELVIVSEWGGGRVQVFKTNGDVFAIFPGVHHAHHLFVEADGSILVSEYATRKIKRFNLDGEWNQLSTSTVSITADCFVMQDRIVRRSKKRKQYDHQKGNPEDSAQIVGEH